MIMNTTTNTINYINRVNNTVTEVLKKTSEATTTIKAIHNSQAFQGLSFKD